PIVLWESFLFGVVVAVASAIVPAIEAAATRPARTIASRGFESRMSRVAGSFAIAGLLILAAAALAARQPAIDGLPVFGYAAALCIILGASFFVPLAVIGSARLLQWLGYRFSSSALLAAANFGGTPRRNSLAVASLAIAVAMIVSVAVSVFSLRATVAAW